MLKYISIFLLAVLSISCEQEPFDEGVQTEENLIYIVAAPHDQYGVGGYLLAFRAVDSNGITANEKLEDAWNTFQINYGGVGTGELFQSWAAMLMDWQNDPNLHQLNPDIKILSDVPHNYVSVEYVTGTGDDLPYEWNNITQMFMIPYNLSDFDLDINEIIIIN